MKTDPNYVAFILCDQNILRFGTFAIRLLMTHQQCKDSISVLNPLESPAAFLCLKHNVKLRPMQGLEKASLFTKIWERVKLASSTHESRSKTI